MVWNVGLIDPQTDGTVGLQSNAEHIIATRNIQVAK